MATRMEHYHFADDFPRNVFLYVSVVLLEHYKSVKRVIPEVLFHPRDISLLMGSITSHC